MKKELIDFATWVYVNHPEHSSLINTLIAEHGLVSINSDAQGESRNVSQNEQTKKFFNCPACNRQLLLKVDSVCKCGLHLKSFQLKNV